MCPAAIPSKTAICLRRRSCERVVASDRKTLGFVSLAIGIAAIHSPMQARVASLHLHPLKGGQPLLAVESFEVAEQKGIVGDRRYFGRKGRDGTPTRRQVSLIEREQIAEHAAVLGLEKIPPGAVRSNIETEGIELLQWVDRRIRIGTAVLEVAGPRDPCPKMDALALGLRERMLGNRQGVLARVVRSGVIRNGDAIGVLPDQEPVK
jgi:MOSC domain-containing protein YiiM